MQDKIEQFIFSEDIPTEQNDLEKGLPNGISQTILMKAHPQIIERNSLQDLLYGKIEDDIEKKASPIDIEKK